MSASGKSSNRHSEYTRARLGGGGHGIYADQGRHEREAAERRAVVVNTPAPVVQQPKNQSNIFIDILKALRNELLARKRGL